MGDMDDDDEKIGDYVCICPPRDDNVNESDPGNEGHRPRGASQNALVSVASATGRKLGSFYRIFRDFFWSIYSNNYHWQLFKAITFFNFGLKLFNDTATQLDVDPGAGEIGSGAGELMGAGGTGPGSGATGVADTMDPAGALIAGVAGPTDRLPCGCPRSKKQKFRNS